ncbi:ERF family protein [Nocardiopsis sp. HUAS JQ3]|uniref:ERF family protein n=1 Tax=Nocardiopsis sp. HUAS JQ3 TaxID=3061629 RepID=UPI0023A9C903|nr:ERF family protein [Nocardiopsis sp. HUAS JQ3]WDZ91171.1 ERF family protein [Nocardiopsis sp. HUAS JQ3]
MTATAAPAPVFLVAEERELDEQLAESAAWPTETLAEGLVALQGRLPRIAKGETATVKSDKGSYSYAYADLADVSAELLPIMASVGLSFTARPTLVDGAFLLAYALVHVSGEREEGVYPLPASGNPQAIGSAITYARRYCLLAVTGAAPAADDDDAQAAMPRGGAARGRAADPSAEWVAEARQRLAAARSREDLGVVWNAIGSALGSGRIDQATADRVADQVHARAAELDAERPPAPPAEEPPPAPVEPSAAQVRAAQDRAAEEPPPAPLVGPDLPAAPPAGPPSGPAREETLDALRARAARIAAQHSQNGTDQ